MIVHDYGWQNLLLLIGIILLALGACGVSAGRISLWNLGWAFVIAGLTSAGGYVLLR
jgi:hypothetical protein